LFLPPDESASAFLELCMGIQQKPPRAAVEGRPRPSQKWDCILKECENVTQLGMARRVVGHRHWRACTSLHFICKFQPPLHVVRQKFLESSNRVVQFQDRDGNLLIHIACENNALHDVILALFSPCSGTVPNWRWETSDGLLWFLRNDTACQHGSRRVPWKLC